MSVTTNSPSQASFHPDNQIPLRWACYVSEPLENAVYCFYKAQYLFYKYYFKKITVRSSKEFHEKI